MATTSRPHVRDSTIMATQASVSSLCSESESENDTDRVPTGSKDCKLAVPSGPSLLDRLRAPQKSELTRKHVLRKNPAQGESLPKKRPFYSTNPKSVTPLTRVHKFPDENLMVSARKFFCTACREEISLKWSIIANHITTVKHKQGKVKLAKKESREKDVAEALVAYDKQEHPGGETLSTNQRVYHVKVVTT